MAFSRAFLKTLVPVAALALVAVACGGGGGAKKAASSGSTTSVESTTTTVAGTPAAAAGGPVAATATTKAAGPATTAAAKVNGQSAASYTPPAGATPAKPSPPGTYTYDNQGTSTFGAPPATSSLIVAPPQGTQQTSTNDMGSGGKTMTTLDFKPEGVHLVEVKVTASGQTYDFVGNPPPLAAPTGVKPGQSVAFDLADASRNTSIHVQIDFVRMETITVGGQPVDTMVIHQVGTLSGGLTGTQTMDAWVAPQNDLFVKNHSTGSVKSGPFTANSDVTSTLEKLTPS